MKRLIVVVLAFFALPAFAQIAQDYKFFVPYVQNETDTIPGTQTGGPGLGGCGWLYVGDHDVMYSVMSIDSSHYVLTVDYADTGYSAATGTSSKAVAFKSYITAASSLVLDSVANFAGVANPKDFTSGVLRQKGRVDNIPGAQYIRFRIFGVDVASTHAAAAVGRTLRLSVRTLTYAGN